MTSTGGWPLRQATYLPFGEEFAPQFTTNTRKFTGHERDAESGLYHTLFRKYAPSSGRWLSADPLHGDIGNPQSLNRYGYVANDPVNLIDPLGLDPDCFWDGDCTVDELYDYTNRCIFGGPTFFYDICDSGSSGQVPIENEPIPEVLERDLSEIPTPPISPQVIPPPCSTSQLPQGTSSAIFGPFTQGCNEALNRLAKNKCGTVFGNQGPSPIANTEYRFLPLSRPEIAAQTNSASSVFINSNGAYMTYSPTAGRSIWACLDSASVPRVHHAARIRASAK